MAKPELQARLREGVNQGRGSEYDSIGRSPSFRRPREPGSAEAKRLRLRQGESGDPMVGVSSGLWTPALASLGRGDDDKNGRTHLFASVH
jgi:hypothetical protein